MYLKIKVEHKIPQLQDYIKNRDWVGAIAFLENEKRSILIEILNFIIILSKIILAHYIF